MALVGFVAQLVDGSMGMAYGVTSASLMLALGMAPALASASVHLAEVFTTAASAVSHWRLGNVSWRMTAALALPGAAGGFAGAVLLANVSGEIARPYVSLFLFALGVYVTVRYALREPAPGTAPGHAKLRWGRRRGVFLGLLGGVAGMADAAGGGGWGPLTTPILLARADVAPHRVIGSVDTAEFLVALAASAGFLTHLGAARLDLGWVAALMAGGAVAAPLAAHIVRRLPARLLGVAVGGLVVLTNAWPVLSLVGLSEAVRATFYAVVTLAWVGTAALVWSRIRSGQHPPAGGRRPEARAGGR